MADKEFDPVEFSKQLFEQFEARQADKERVAQERADLKAELQAEVESEFEGERKAWAEQHGVANVKKVTELGSGGDNGDMKSFKHYLRTGDEIAARKALQEDTGSEGGYLVPDDFYSGIVELRDPISWPRIAGVQVITTGRDKIDIPAEATSLAKFTRTAEEGSFSTNDPAFAQNQVTVENWTKLTKVSTQLLDDDACDFEGWFQRALARSMAATEAYYVAVGSGTNQHLGIFTGGDTDTMIVDTDNGGDSDFTTQFPAEAVWKLFYKLGEGYRDGAVWLMDPLTEGGIVSRMSTKEFEWKAGNQADWVDGKLQLCGKPVYNQDDIPVQASAVCFAMLGHPYYFALVERKGLSVQRLSELYAASGQIGFASTFRQGGTVLYESAWVGAVGA